MCYVVTTGSFPVGQY